VPRPDVGAPFVGSSMLQKATKRTMGWPPEWRADPTLHTAGRAQRRANANTGANANFRKRPFQDLRSLLVPCVTVLAAVVSVVVARATAFSHLAAQSATRPRCAIRLLQMLTPTGAPPPSGVALRTLYSFAQFDASSYSLCSRSVSHLVERPSSWSASRVDQRVSRHAAGRAERW
jgi:hypothetical protein